MRGIARPTPTLRGTDAHRDPAPRFGERRNATAERFFGRGWEDDDDILFEARERFRLILDWEGEFRSQYADDTKFVHGDSDNHWQWPASMYADRGDKPSLTINKTRQHCLQIINDAKQNKPQIRINPVSDEATKASADVLEGVVRHIEYMSNASVAYDTATEHQVHGGIGWWRVIVAYEDEDSLQQSCRIERVRDAMSVYMDPDIKEVDGSDARYAFVVDDVPRDEFEGKYPEYRDRIPQGGTAGPIIEGGWLDDDHVRVAEYFRIVEFDDVLHLLPDGSTIRESELNSQGVISDLNSLSLHSRRMRRRELQWLKIVGGEIVDRQVEIGKYIPLIRVIGEETVIEGRLERKGHVRALKDPQRIYNYWAPLSLHTRLPTPTGWTTMADVKIGDQLLDEKGQPTTVLGKSPVHLYRQCFRIEFDDGSHIIADAQHPWAVEERGKAIPGGWQWIDKTVSTEELTPKKHFIHMPRPLDLLEADLPVDPYLLGMWLGNGTANNNTVTITNGTIDLDETRQHLAESGYRLSPARLHATGSAATFTIYGMAPTFRAMGLFGNKHIPEIYLRASEGQRWALLQGLMDTDGSANTRLKTCSFTTAIPALSDGFAELLSTLGLKSVRLHRPAARRLMPGGNYSNCLPTDQFTFSASPDVQVFRLQRKRSVQEAERITHWRRTKRFRIKSVTPVPSEPVQCVGVEAPSHLFLAGASMVPTHNSSAVEQVALQSKSPYIAAAESIEGYQDYWKHANTENWPTLPYNARDDQGNPLPPPQRQEPPQIAQAYVVGMQHAQQDLMFASGQYQPTMGQPPPNTEISGKAIALRQRQGDNATYHFVDNLAIAIRFTGRVLLDLIPKIYDTPRILQILAPDGTVDRVQLNPRQPQALMSLPQPNPTQAQTTGSILPPTPQQAMAASVIRIFNPNVGKYEVQADVGPAYATRRQQSFDAFMQILATAPQIMSLAGDLLMKNADFPQAEELAERLARMVPPQAMGQGPSPQEAQQAQQIQGLQAHVALLSEQLAVEKMRRSARDQRTDIDAYEAVTKRMGALLSMRDTDSPYADGNEVRTLIMQMVTDALRQVGMAPVSNAAMADEQQQMGAILSGMQGQAPPGAPPPGTAPAGMIGPMASALSPVRPPNVRMPQPAPNPLGG